MDRPVSQVRPSKQRSPPGFPECLLPGLALTNQQQALMTQAVVGQVQAMLAQFEQSFEKRLSQVEAQTPRERSLSPLGRSTSRLRRSGDFSSQEESLANDDGKLASVVRSLSPRAAQARPTALDKPAFPNSVALRGSSNVHHLAIYFRSGYLGQA